MSADPRVFAQFRRLLLGIVVEALQAEGVHADLAGLQHGFDPETGFRFLWFDNWMRFKGWVRAPLTERLDAGQVARLQERFGAVWPDIIGAVGTLPLADKVEITRDEVWVTADAVLTVRFDFEAD